MSRQPDVLTRAGVPPGEVVPPDMAVIAVCRVTEQDQSVMAPTAGLPAEAQMLPGTDPLAGDPDVAAANQAALMGMDMGAGDAIARAREAAAQPDAPVEGSPGSSRHRSR